MNTETYDLTVVIPAYNEELRILPTLEKIEAYRRTSVRSIEVIVVDDCSRDQTHAVVKKFMEGKDGLRLLKNDFNSGKGASVRAGVMEAQGQSILFSDADLSTPIEDVEKLWPYLKGGFGTGKEGVYDVVIGSRRLRGAQLIKRQPVLREGAGRIFSLLVRIITLPGFLDTQCGFKLFTRSAALDIFRRQTINGFGFDVELLYIAVKKLGLKVKEAPVSWMDSPATRVQFFRDSCRMFWDLILIRLNDHDRKYQ